MSILLYTSSQQSAMREALQMQLPDERVLTREEAFDAAEIRTAVVWQPPSDFFDGLVNLQQVYALAAGVDQLLTHPGLPDSVPVIRLLDAGMGVQMAEFVLYGVLHAHRGWPALQQARRRCEWAHSISWPPASAITVGLLGVGTLGSEVARRCLLNGYPVRGWSRREKTLEGVQMFAGRDALPGFLADLDVLACLLPLTPETRGILSADLFRHLPQGSFLINPARGEHLVEADLRDALDSGRLSGALLDVFSTEPLPVGHPFWEDQRILISPHIAAPSPVDTSIAQIVDNIRRTRNGQSPVGVVDRQLGY